MIHQNQALLAAGTALDKAQAAVVLLHGRGSSAHDILSLAAYLPQDGIAYLAPQAANHTWYPNSGFMPIEANEPYVSSAFQTLDDLLDRIETAGISAEHIALGGFSQGACLSSEYVARHAQRYGGLIVFSGALMGPLDSPRDYSGSLEGTPVYIGGCTQDPWVQEAQMRLTAEVLQQLGGSVDIDIQPGAEHTVRENDIAAARDLITALGTPMS